MAAGNARHPYRISDFKGIAGASFRMVLDVGDWDESRFINTPGQSCDACSPHYRDLALFWAAGDYAPLLHSRGDREGGALGHRAQACRLRQ